jgi:hypothetical protein
VPCDNPNAVKAGVGLYGEPKYLAQFDYTTPTLNDPAVVTWNYSVLQNSPNNQPGPLVYSIDADLQGIAPQPGNPSPLIEYGTRKLGGRTHVVGNFWNFYGPFMTYPLEDEGASRVSLGVGPSPDPDGLIGDLRELIGTTAPVAAQTFTSAPVSSECAPWLMEPV